MFDALQSEFLLMPVLLPLLITGPFQREARACVMVWLDVAHAGCAFNTVPRL